MKGGFLIKRIIKIIIGGSISSFILPTIIVVSFFIVAFFALPATLTSASFSLDFLSGDNDNDTAQAWEQKAQAEIDKRYAQISTKTWWDDLMTFFTEGQFGNSNETFKTELADADDYDENGNSISSNYFSGSNRLIAIINEAFRISKTDESKNGFLAGDTTLKTARNAAEDMAASVRNSELYRSTLIGNGVDTSKPINVYTKTTYVTNDEDNYIYQSCFLLSCTSVVSTQDKDYENATKRALDLVFELTGIDPSTNPNFELCWDPVVTPEVEKFEVIEEYVTDYSNFIGYAVNGDRNNIVREKPEDLPDGNTYEEVYGTKKVVKEYNIHFNYKYTVILKENVDDIIINMLNIDKDEKLFDNENAKTDMYDLIINQTNNLYKFYMGISNIKLENVGLPLPERSYVIGCTFSCNCSVHLGTGILHGAQDFTSIGYYDENNAFITPHTARIPVYAIADGVVVSTVSGKPNTTDFNAYKNSAEAQNKANWLGNRVYIKHGDESSGEVFYSLYGHLDPTVEVTAGQEVRRGDLIGYVGTSGYSTGFHLHFVLQNANQQAIDIIGTGFWPLIQQYERSY